MGDCCVTALISRSISPGIFLSLRVIFVHSSSPRYTWGYGDMLQLGHGKEEDEFTPRLVERRKALRSKGRILNGDCGGQHSAVIVAE